MRKKYFSDGASVIVFLYSNQIFYKKCASLSLKADDLKMEILAAFQHLSKNLNVYTYFSLSNIDKLGSNLDSVLTDSVVSL